MYRGLPSRKAPWTKRTGLGGRITPMRTTSFSPICQHSHGRIRSRSISGSLCSVVERSKAAQITRQRPALLICIIKRVSYNIAHCTWRSGLSCCIAYTPAYVPRPPVVHSVCDVNTHTHNPPRGDLRAGRPEALLCEGNQGLLHIPFCSPIRDSHSNSPIVCTHVISTGTHIYIHICSCSM